MLWQAETLESVLQEKNETGVSDASKVSELQELLLSKAEDFEAMRINQAQELQQAVAASQEGSMQEKRGMRDELGQLQSTLSDTRLELSEVPLLLCSM